MKFKDILGLSLGNLRRRKWRTVLTVTGVFIGTISVVIMLSLGFGLKTSITEEMSSYVGMNEITITYNGSDRSIQITDEKLSEFEELEFVEKCEPYLAAAVELEQGKWYVSATIIGINADEFAKIPIGEGHAPDPDEDEMQVIIGNQIITDAYDSRTYRYPYWEDGELADMDFMEDTVYFKFMSEENFRLDDDGNIINTAPKKIVPIAGVVAGDVNTYNKYSYAVWAEIDSLKSYLHRVYKGGVIYGQPTDRNGNALSGWVYQMADIIVDDRDNVEKAVEYFREMGYQVDNNQEWIEQTNNILFIAQCVLGGIGAVALLVAAIGITNTITMSAYERRKEIGIMKVLGCDISDICGMFIGEAAFIGFLGGVVGVILSYGISFAVNILAGPMAAQAVEMGNLKLSVIPIWLPFVAIAFSTFIGVLAGYFPAKKATKMSPLLAIRNE